jgi:hypothetical protein
MGNGLDKKRWRFLRGGVHQLLHFVEKEHAGHHLKAHEVNVIRPID